MHAILGIMANPAFDPCKKFLIIVDSSLSSLAAINDRREPILGDFMLPPGFHLSYASADTGRHLVHNVIMQHCDKEASRLVDMIKGGMGDPSALLPSGTPHASLARSWLPTGAIPTAPTATP
jgi:hypothetical protein